jgi:ubiquinone/menaquinone biosynthesis C-methylase UbiE
MPAVKNDGGFMSADTPSPLPTSGLSRQEVFDRFSLIVNGPALFNAIVAAAELGLFAALEASPGIGAAALAEHARVSPGKLRVLMFSLCSTGLIEHTAEGGYVNTELASEFLSNDGPESWVHILRGWHRLYYPAFGHLTAALREDRNSALDEYPGQEATVYSRLQHSPELEGVLHRAMSAFTLQSMSGLLDHADLSDVRHLLDIGGGDGVTALALVQRYPELNITIVDLPSVAERAATLSAHERISVTGGDVFEMELPSCVDAVLFSHFLEVFSEAEIQKLLAKGFAAVRPGGQALIYGFNAGKEETDGIYSARLALYLTALATGNGMTYPAHDYEGWLREAGFEDVGTVEALPYEHGLTTGRKPLNI